MKTQTRMSRSTPANLPVAAIFACLIFGQFLRAQSATLFKLIENKPASTELEKVIDPVSEMERLKSKPSRYAIGNVDLFILAHSSELAMRDRATDPFGLYQDPKAKPKIKNPSSLSPNRRLSALPPVSLSEIIKLIKVTTIMPKEKQFLVEGRLFKESEEFPLVFQGRTKRMKVLGVSATHIIFQDLDSSEEASLKIEVLPEGMKFGDEKMQPPGMISPTDSQPLLLESRSSR